jgi:hypothetical protein
MTTAEQIIKVFDHVVCVGIIIVFTLAMLGVFDKGE